MQSGRHVLLAACVLVAASGSCLKKDNPLWNLLPSESGDATGTSSSSGASTTATTDASTSAASQSTTTGGSTSTTGSASTGVAATSGGNDPCDFFDDFERSAGNALRNGWIEKTPTAVGIKDGRVAYESMGAAYFDSVWYRPDMQCDDVEVSIEVHLDSILEFGFPQVHARIQTDTIAGGLDSYICFLENGTELRIRRHRTGFGAAELDISSFSAILDTAETYRLRMRVSGSDPVAIECDWELRSGMSWSAQASITLVDDTPERITGPGTFGSSINGTSMMYSYDNYRSAAIP